MVKQNPNAVSPALLDAVKANQSETVVHKIGAGANVNFRDEKGRTPLWHACAGGFLPVVKILTQNGANIAAKDKDGIHGEDIARRKGQPHVVYWLQARRRAQVSPKFTDFSTGSLECRRVALCFGQAEYMNQSVANAISDVQLISKRLQLLQFAVHERYNRTKNEMLMDVEAFASTLRETDFVFVYYSGLARRQFKFTELLGVDNSWECAPNGESLTLEELSDRLLYRHPIDRRRCAQIPDFRSNQKRGPTVIVVDACQKLFSTHDRSLMVRLPSIQPTRFKDIARERIRRENEEKFRAAGGDGIWSVLPRTAPANAPRPDARAKSVPAVEFRPATTAGAPNRTQRYGHPRSLTSPNENLRTRSSEGTLMRACVLRNRSQREQAVVDSDIRPQRLKKEAWNPESLQSGLYYPLTTFAEALQPEGPLNFIGQGGTQIVNMNNAPQAVILMSHRPLEVYA